MPAPPRSPWWLTTTLVVGACVNNYVVDDPRTDSTGQGSEGSRTDEGTADQGSADQGPTSDSDHADGSGDSGTGGSTGESGTGSTSGGPLEACQPCVADAECGGEFDLCVDLGTGPVCLRVCTEPPRECSPGFSCMPATSVEGAEVPQCVPETGRCAR